MKMFANYSQHEILSGSLSLFQLTSKKQKTKQKRNGQTANNDDETSFLFDSDWNEWEEEENRQKEKKRDECCVTKQNRKEFFNGETLEVLYILNKKRQKKGGGWRHPSSDMQNISLGCRRRWWLGGIVVVVWRFFSFSGSELRWGKTLGNQSKAYIYK